MINVIGIFLFILPPLLLVSPALAAEKSREEQAVEQRQKVDILSFFLKDPKTAEVPKTPMAAGLYNQAVEHFQRSDYELARQALQDSISYDNKNPLAYELLGDVDYYEQKLSDAKGHYETAYGLQPSAGLQKKIEKIRDESRVERNLSTYREQHFIIKYKNSEQQFEGFELRELLRETYRNISQEFAYYFNHQVVVILYDEDDFRKITNAPHWAAGLYDGKVRMPVSRKGFGETDLRALTAHEVTHAFVAAMSGNQAPGWINEGLAEYMEAKIKKSDQIIFKAALKTNRLIPADQLMLPSSALGMNDTLQIGLFYQQSLEMVSFMVKRYGMFRVKQVLAEYGKGSNSDEALRNVLHISPVRLESEWKSSL